VPTVRGIIIILIAVSFTACVGIGLKDSTRQELQELRETANQLGGKIGEIADGFQKEIRNICDVTEQKVSEAQQSIAAACEGIADAEKKRQCQEFNRRQEDLIDQIRRECESSQ